MLGRAAPVLIVLAAVVAPFRAESRVVSVSTGGTTRVSKAPRQPLTMFYASYLGPKEVQIWPQPGHVEIGQRFEIIDDRGWVGTVEISAVHQQDNGCGQPYDVGNASFVGSPRWSSYGGIWAIGPGARATTRAKQLMYSEVASAPPGNRMLMQFVDLDGDGDPEVARHNGYDCEVEPDGTMRQVPGNGVTCFVMWSRLDGSTWRVSMSGTVDPC